jgi:2-polyprenyl-6-methoxyphenol hydroxylase-like FAD-dependent oxidoreductase
MVPTSPIIVVGGGIGGLAVALALRRAGLDAMVYEQARAIREVGAGLLLTPNACIALERLGVLSTVEGYSVRSREWRILRQDGRTISRLGPFSPRMPGLGIARSDLQSALAGALGADSIRCGYEAASVIARGAEAVVEFRNGERAASHLVVAADGARSVLRGHSPLRSAGYVGWRGLVRGVPEGWADGRVTESWGRGARFGIAPIGLGRTYWYASANLTALDARDEGTPEERLDRLAERFRGWHAPIASLLQSTPPDLVLRHEIADARPASGVALDGRVALIGDAAHPFTPNLGQGAAIALEDAVALADCLSSSPDTPAGVHAYAKSRRMRALAVWGASNAMGRAIQTPRASCSALRDLIVDATPDRVATLSLKWLMMPGGSS